MGDKCPFKEEQNEFYKKHKAGCSFAAYAAKEPQRYGWYKKVISRKKKEVEATIRQTIRNEEKCSTLSLLFPKISSPKGLIKLIQTLVECRQIVTERREVTNYICFGFRVRLENSLSWVSGFGPFSFFPKTRQAPYTEIVFRIRERPNYEWVMKKSPQGIVHLADMDMQGLPKDQFKKMWRRSLEKTEEILGKKPDLLSAAKTTFVIPKPLWNKKL